MTVAVAGQPPLEPRGGGGGARARWGGVEEGRGGGGEEATAGAEGGSLCGQEALETHTLIPEKFLFLLGQEGQSAPYPLPLPKKPHRATPVFMPILVRGNSLV